MTNTERHMIVCMELNDIYERKNHDYGDSFSKTWEEEGFAMARIRLTDKLERFKQLTRQGNQQVDDETVRDTLLDLANYAIMTVMELDNLPRQKSSGDKPSSKYADTWRRFELQFEEGSEECQELYKLLETLGLTRHELALIVLGLRAQPQFGLADFAD